VSILLVLSPAKSLDYETPPTVSAHTLPDYVPQALELIGQLRQFTPVQVARLMDISDALAALNVARYEAFSEVFTPANAKQALLAFNGDVYEGLDAGTLDSQALDYAQQHVRILSGLYGLLRPLDLMQPYRLEMGTRLSNAKGKDLYAFWKPVIADHLNDLLPHSGDVLVNLASEEYFKSVDTKRLSKPVITPVFEDFKGDRFKIISFYAKRARGLMARYSIDHRISDVQALKSFDSEGYAYCAQASTDHTWVFRRQETT
jgi:cytoplasmic iron level regulating protein YaaA (DUF328/UPF0246 family)